MKRILTITFALVLTLMTSYRLEAQTFGGPESMKGKVVVGGDFGLGLYGGAFYVGVAPQAGYRLTRSLEAGVRLGYDLYYNYNYLSGNYFCHYFSGSAYLNYEVFSGFFLHVEDEELCLLVRGHDINPTAPTWYNSVVAGIGYRQYWGSGFTFYSLLYNISWDYNSPYNSPFMVRVGYCYAL